MSSKVTEEDNATRRCIAKATKGSQFIRPLRLAPELPLLGNRERHDSKSFFGTSEAYDPTNILGQLAVLAKRMKKFPPPSTGTGIIGNFDCSPKQSSNLGISI